MRPPRILHAPTIHLLNRGADRQDIFRTDADWHTFEAKIAEVADEHQIVVLAYALLSNHFHLLIEPAGADVPVAMRRLQSEYAQSFNRHGGRSGPVFDHRYVSVPAFERSVATVMIRYVHRNPLDITGTRNLVAYRFSSLAAVVGRRRPPPFLAVDRTREYVDPAAHLADVLRPRPSDRLPYAFLPPQRATRFGDLTAAADRLARTGIGAADLRLALLVLGLRTRAADEQRLAEHYAIGTRTVRNLASNGRAREAIDEAFARLLVRLLEELDRPDTTGAAGDDPPDPSSVADDVA